MDLTILKKLKKDPLGTLQQIGEDTVTNVKEFIPALAEEASKDARDMVRAASMNPSVMLMNAVSGNKVQKLWDDTARKLGVAEDDIKDLDYRNHSVTDNVRAGANSAFNVATTALGLPGIKAAGKGAKVLYKGTKSLGSAGVHMGKVAKDTGKGVKAAVNPRQWSKTQKIKSYKTYREGARIENPLVKIPVRSGKGTDYINDYKIVERIRVDPKSLKYRTVYSNPQMDQFMKSASDGMRAVTTALKEFPGVKQMIQATKNLRGLLPFSIPGAESSARAGIKTAEQRAFTPLGNNGPVNKEDEYVNEE